MLGSAAVRPSRSLAGTIAAGCLAAALSAGAAFPAASAPAAKRAFSRDDFLGVWIIPGADDTLDRNLRGTGWTPDPSQMFTPWGAEESKRLYTHVTPGDCDPWGPLVSGGPLFPIEISRTANGYLFSYEVTVLPRRIFTDGRKHPADLDPNWMGHSIGHWEGETLVVDTVGSNGRTRPINGYVDGAVTASRQSYAARLPQSEQLHVVERYHLVAGGQFLEADITVTDPKTYKTPFSSKRFWERRPDLDMQEYYCSENRREDSEGQGVKQPTTVPKIYEQGR